MYNPLLAGTKYEQKPPPPPQPSGGGSSSPYDANRIANLWVQRGGDPRVAPLMAQIALAESSGDPNSNRAGGTSYVEKGKRYYPQGLFQVSTIHGLQNMFDPAANVDAAIRLSGNGRNLGPWQASRDKWGRYAQQQGALVGDMTLPTQQGNPLLQGALPTGQPSAPPAAPSGNPLLHGALPGAQQPAARPRSVTADMSPMQRRAYTMALLGGQQPARPSPLRTALDAADVPLAYAEAMVSDIPWMATHPKAGMAEAPAQAAVDRHLREGGPSMVAAHDVAFRPQAMQDVLNDPTASPANKAVANYFLKNPTAAGAMDFWQEFYNPLFMAIPVLAPVLRPAIKAGLAHADAWIPLFEDTRGIAAHIANVVGQPVADVTAWLTKQAGRAMYFAVRKTPGTMGHVLNGVIDRYAGLAARGGPTYVHAALATNAAPEHAMAVGDRFFDDMYRGLTQQQHNKLQALSYVNPDGTMMANPADWRHVPEPQGMPIAARAAGVRTYMMNRDDQQMALGIRKKTEVIAPSPRKQVQTKGEAQPTIKAGQIHNSGTYWPMGMEHMPGQEAEPVFKSQIPIKEEKQGGPIGQEGVVDVTGLEAGRGRSRGKFSVGVTKRKPKKEGPLLKPEDYDPEEMHPEYLSGFQVKAHYNEVNRAIANEQQLRKLETLPSIDPATGKQWQVQYQGYEPQPLFARMPRYYALLNRESPEIFGFGPQGEAAIKRYIYRKGYGRATSRARQDPVLLQRAAEAGISPEQLADLIDARKLRNVRAAPLKARTLEAKMNRQRAEKFLQASQNRLMKLTEAEEALQGQITSAEAMTPIHEPAAAKPREAGEPPPGAPPRVPARLEIVKSEPDEGHPNALYNVIERDPSAPNGYTLHYVNDDPKKAEAFMKRAEKKQAPSVATEPAEGKPTPIRAVTEADRPPSAVVPSPRFEIHKNEQHGWYEVTEHFPYGRSRMISSGGTDLQELQDWVKWMEEEHPQEVPGGYELFTADEARAIGNLWGELWHGLSPKRLRALRDYLDGTHDLDPKIMGKEIDKARQLKEQVAAETQRGAAEIAHEEEIRAQARRHAAAIKQKAEAQVGKPPKKAPKSASVGKPPKRGEMLQAPADIRYRGHMIVKQPLRPEWDVMKGGHRLYTAKSADEAHQAVDDLLGPYGEETTPRVRGQDEKLKDAMTQISYGAKEVRPGTVRWTENAGRTMRTYEIPSEDMVAWHDQYGGQRDKYSAEKQLATRSKLVSEWTTGDVTAAAAKELRGTEPLKPSKTGTYLDWPGRTVRMTPKKIVTTPEFEEGKPSGFTAQTYENFLNIHGHGATEEAAKADFLAQIERFRIPDRYKAEWPKDDPAVQRAIAAGKKAQGIPADEPAPPRAEDTTRFTPPGKFTLAFLNPVQPGHLDKIAAEVAASGERPVVDAWFDPKRNVYWVTDGAHRAEAAYARGIAPILDLQRGERGMNYWRTMAPLDDPEFHGSGWATFDASGPVAKGSGSFPEAEPPRAQPPPVKKTAEQRAADRIERDFPSKPHRPKAEPPKQDVLTPEELKAVQQVFGTVPRPKVLRALRQSFDGRDLDPAVWGTELVAQAKQARDLLPERPDIEAFERELAHKGDTPEVRGAYDKVFQRIANGKEPNVAGVDPALVQAARKLADDYTWLTYPEFLDHLGIKPGEGPRMPPAKPPPGEPPAAAAPPPPPPEPPKEPAQRFGPYGGPMTGKQAAEHEQYVRDLPPPVTAEGKLTEDGLAAARSLNAQRMRDLVRTGDLKWIEGATDESLRNARLAAYKLVRQSEDRVRKLEDEFLQRVAVSKTAEAYRDAIKFHMGRAQKEAEDEIMAEADKYAQPKGYVLESKALANASPSSPNMVIDDQWADFIKGAQPMTFNEQADARKVWKAMQVLNRLTRLGIVLIPTVHAITNLGTHYLAEGGDPFRMAIILDPRHSLEDLRVKLGWAPDAISRAIGTGTATETSRRAFAHLFPDLLPPRLEMAPVREQARIKGLQTNKAVGSGAALLGYGDKAYQAANNWLFGNVEMGYAIDLFDRFTKPISKGGYGLSDGAAALRVRNAMGRYDNVSPRELAWGLNRMFYFYPWMKTVMRFWSKKAITDPKWWGAPVAAIRTNNELMGYDDPSKPFAMTVRDMGHGKYLQWSVPLPQRIIGAMADLARLAPDVASGKVSPTTMFQEDILPTTNYFAGHLNPFLGVLYQLNEVATNRGDVTRVAPYNIFRGQPGQEPASYYGSVAARTAEAFANPVERASTFLSDPIGTAAAFLVGGTLYEQKGEDLKYREQVVQHKIDGDWAMTVHNARIAAGLSGDNRQLNAIIRVRQMIIDRAKQQMENPKSYPSAPGGVVVRPGGAAPLPMPTPPSAPAGGNPLLKGALPQP